MPNAGHPSACLPLWLIDRYSGVSNLLRLSQLGRPPHRGRNSNFSLTFLLVEEYFRFVNTGDGRHGSPDTHRKGNATPEEDSAILKF